MLTSNTINKGINQDVHPKFQPEGTYRYALNSILETEQGELGSISNELGNISAATNFPTAKIPIGHVLTDTDSAIIFVYDPDSSHEIGEFNVATNTYTTIATGSCLNFSPNYPVSALFRIRNGCNKVIYFTDNYNPYRVIDITDTSDWLDAGTITDCNKIKLARDYSIPCITLFIGEGDVGIVDGEGQLKLGTYYFALRYLDEKLNPTPWVLITRPVAVANEPFNYTSNATTVNLYDGGSNVSDSPFYMPPSNKSIKLQLSSLDSDTFVYYQIAVVKRTGDAGEIEGVDVLFPTNINSTTSVFTYTGTDNQIQTATTLDDLLSSLQSIDVVAAHTQLDNRLYLANTTNTSYDWSLFQRYASKIKVRWVKDPSVSPIDAFVKQPNYYFTQASLMEDEIYAIGIIYEMEDGSLSPVFHIPGRAPDVVTGDNPIIGTAGVATDADTWDTGTTTSYGTGLPASKTKRWQQISTATKEGPNFLRGLMGYHEAIIETYPDLPTCDDDPDGYWGRDWQDNLIEPGVTKIRHHRMPGAELAADAFTNTNTHQVGLLISNVEYPPNAVRHFFVYSDRTSEKSILAKGALIPLPTYTELEDISLPLTFFGTEFVGERLLIFSPEVLRPNEYPITTVPEENFRSFAFICSEGILRDKSFSPLYFRLEKFLFDPESEYFGGPDGLANNVDNGSLFIPKYDTTLEVNTDLWYYSDPEYPTEQWNYDISAFAKAPKPNAGDKHGIITPIATDRSVYNLSYNISPYIITLESQIAEWVTGGVVPQNRIPYGSIKVDVDPFTNLFAINYRRMGNCKHNALTTSTLFTTFSGDTFVSRVNLTDYAYSQSEAEGKDINAFHIAFPTQDTGINYEFRHGSTDPRYSYFQWDYNYTETGHEQLRHHIVSKYYENTDNIMELYAQNFGYNDSYSYMQSLELYYPLPFNYEFCNDCVEKNPFRIYYSEYDNAELPNDNYRIIRPNNYRDLDGSTGSITDLFINFDQLYALTTNSPYHIPTRPQELQTDTSQVYIGTGEVLSIPPKQLKTTDFAFGGTNFFKSRVSTIYGTVYVDDISGRPFLLTNQLNDLSNLGLRNFWQEHGHVEFLSQFENLTSTIYPYKSTSSSIGVGYISTYDPRYKRVIIHKRDFKILPTWINKFHYEDATVDDVSDFVTQDRLWFNNFKFYHNDTLGNQKEVHFTNPTFFENLSFTLSYSFVTNSWVSFHSYFPNYAFNTYNDFYTSNNSGIWQHNEGDFQTYYNAKYPHVIDIIALQNPAEAKIATSVIYSATTSTYDPATNEWATIDPTFSRLTAYNSNQTTGTLTLNLKDSPFETSSNFEAIVSKVDKQYRINQLRDITFSNTSPIWSSSWNWLQSAPYIDKVPNPDNINAFKSPFDLQRLRDYYLGLRLFFDPTQNYKITTDLINTLSANRNR